MLNALMFYLMLAQKNKEEIKSLINWTKKKNIDIRHVTAARKDGLKYQRLRQ